MTKVSITDDERGDSFVHFDEFEDVVLALELVAMLAKDVRERDSHWKWIVIGMQNAVQAAMVLALAGTDECGALETESQRQNREWLTHCSGKRPRTKMANYSVLLDRVQQSSLMAGPPLTLSADELENLKRLNRVRRGFAHFNPTGWGIELNYLLNIMPVALTTVEFLLGTQDSPQIHLTDERKSRIANAIATARDSFAAFPRSP